MQTPWVNENMYNHTIKKARIDGNELEVNNFNDDSHFLNIRIPVILGKYNIEVCLEDEEIFKEEVKEIREISNKVELANCKFMPSKMSSELDNGLRKVLNGHLVIEGNIHQDIQYVFEKKQTSLPLLDSSSSNQMNRKSSIFLRKFNLGTYGYVPQIYLTQKSTAASGLQTNHVQLSERQINTMSKSIPFSSVVKIDQFLHLPLAGSNEGTSFMLPDRMDSKGPRDETIQFSTTTYYPDSIMGKLIYSRVHENMDVLNHEEKYRKPRIKLKQYFILELAIQLLQEQTVQIQSSCKGFNHSLSY